MQGQLRERVWGLGFGVSGKANLSTEPRVSYFTPPAPFLFLRALLQGEKNAYRDAVLLNAAAALVVADAAADLREGLEEAAETLDRGLANALLNCWIAYT